jgi:glycosyltransferase involved in cell wall biosynthesis
VTKAPKRLPKAAIITRTLNRPLMLERALSSIAGQTFRDFVWVIVNDGGEPAPVDALAGRARDKGFAVTVIHHKVSRGMEAASNAGIAESRSDYIAIHDDDDTWEPDFLKRTTAFLDAAPHYVGAVTRVTTVTEKITDGSIELVGKAPHHPQFKTILLADLAQKNLFPPISLLFRRSLLKKLKGFDETMPVLGDWDFNLRALTIGDIGVIPEPLANYHVRPAHKLDAQYGNSVHAQLTRHEETDAIYRNRKLREDLAKGEAGLGFLLALGRMTSRQRKAASPQPLKSLIDRFSGRKKT